VKNKKGGKIDLNKLKKNINMGIGKTFLIKLNEIKIYHNAFKIRIKIRWTLKLKTFKITITKRPKRLKQLLSQILPNFKNNFRKNLSQERK